MMLLRVKVQVITCRRLQRLLKASEITETGGILAPRMGRSTAEKQDLPTTYRMRCVYCQGVCDWIEFKPKRSKK